VIFRRFSFKVWTRNVCYYSDARSRAEFSLDLGDSNLGGVVIVLIIIWAFKCFRLLGNVIEKTVGLNFLCLVRFPIKRSVLVRSS